MDRTKITNRTNYNNNRLGSGSCAHQIHRQSSQQNKKQVPKVIWFQIPWESPARKGELSTQALMFHGEPICFYAEPSTLDRHPRMVQY